MASSHHRRSREGALLSTVLSFKPTVALLDEPPPLLEALPLAMYACNSSGHIRWFNRRAVALWGREPKLNDPAHRFCGSLKLHRTDGQALPHDQTAMAETLRTGIPADNVEAIVERPDGSRIATRIHTIPIKSSDDRVLGAVNCFHEIPESNAVLRNTGEEDEQRCRELLEALPTAIYTTDISGRITFYNQAAAELWGRRPEIGTDFWCGSWKLFWMDGRPMEHEACPLAIALKERRVVRGCEAMAERPDGTRFSFIPYPTPLHNGRGEMIGAINMLVDITERKSAEERLELLAREVNHRAKNMLAVIQSIIRLSTTKETRAFSDVLLGRITALGRAHSLLSENRWKSAGLNRLIEEELAPFREGNDVRVKISGPHLALTASAAQPLSMALHELATNAAKYGALSTPNGRVAIEWVRNPDGRVILRWIESGGPAVTVPTRQNFGLNVIGIVVRSQLSGAVSFDWRPDGLICTAEIPATLID
jgi:PAS domain S-box-containing protein